jgi:6-phosphofructokinase 1
MHIAVLTGGGDVPGLNPCIRAITLAALDRGWRVSGICRGWQGLLDDSALFPLDRERVRGIDRRGGTILHTSRLTAVEKPMQ